MADPSKAPPLTRASVQAAHARIAPHIHHTPVATCATLNNIASTPIGQRAAELRVAADESEAPEDAAPKISLFFKCENQQRIGAFKARGAFHALGRLIEQDGIEEVRRRGVATHSSGNHAQALALAAKTFAVPAHIVMPTISTPSKIAGTKSHGARVYFSGSTAPEREAVVADIIARTGATLVPPYDHPDIILGQGTQALEFQEQVQAIRAEDSAHEDSAPPGGLDAVITACGGGGMLSGVCVALQHQNIAVFGAEPSFQGANDAERGLAAGARVTAVSSSTIADGVRTPLGELPWKVLSSTEPENPLKGVYSVTEAQITLALRLAMERAKLFIEPTAAVPLAVVLFNERFRRKVRELQAEQGKTEQGWNVGVVLSGGNTTVEALAAIFGK